MCYYQVSVMLSHEIVQILICIPQAGVGKLNSQDVYLMSIIYDILFYSRYLLQAWSYLAYVLLAREDSRRSYSLVRNLSIIP